MNQAEQSNTSLENSRPLVTVGVPLYNHERYIIQCVSSILEQTFSDFELIVVDDGSSDASLDVLSRFLKEDYRSNVKIISRPNKGICGTLNDIAREARGVYVSTVGSDDYWHPDRLEKMVGYMREHAHCGVVHSNSLKVDADDKVVGKVDYSVKKNAGNLYKAIIFGDGGVNPTSSLYLREVYERIGYFDESLSFEDTDFYLRLCKCYQAGFIDEDLAYYRWHGENFSIKSAKGREYYRQFEKIYLKNIDDHSLRTSAIKRMYRKACRKSLANLQLGDFTYYFKRMLNANNVQ